MVKTALTKPTNCFPPQTKTFVLSLNPCVQWARSSFKASDPGQVHRLRMPLPRPRKAAPPRPRPIALAAASP